MFSINVDPSLLFVSPFCFRCLSSHSFPSTVFIVNARKRARKQENSSSLVTFKTSCGSGALFGFSAEDFGSGRCENGSGWDSEEEDWVLEAEILEFMKNSERPDKFPSKKELVNAGRIDLVEGILRQGGWLSMGWDSDNDGGEKHVQESYYTGWDDGFLQERVLEGNEERVSSFTVDSSSSSASSSGISLETAAENDFGIEGILSRLEKERNLEFGFSKLEEGSSAHTQHNYGEDVQIHKTSMKGKMLGQSPSLSNFDGFGDSLKPEMGKSCETQTAGFSDMDCKGDDILEVKSCVSEPVSMENNPYTEVITKSQVQNHLQHMESELSSVLNSFRLNSDEKSILQKDLKNSDDLLKLSDAWEFQENEIMNARDRLRSLRAKIAVLQGKYALAIIDARKIVEEKQRRIDDAHRALRLLRSACIVWPNSASEVLLAGSFDGWTSQRKMEKSSTGIFSVSLKLYPGKYEIKFIVDGEWRVDPLRPIVNNNGYENNTLIIH
ncbi:protein PTST homolog 2, chloroplastic isoform X2 [Tripterygium wilfordii]|uniref:protein PTST homolog 2, chloroplastic isoform X2 n=1 Tax=Tripterygium wilfordii TaxID=458696 RepID=UPI0018F81666|nr:protein PTST homolog 2, chloroplastic isoform X2 [Tripterygium wilfordii]